MSSTGGEIKSVSTWLEQNNILEQELKRLDKDNNKLDEKGKALNDAIENSETQLQKIQDEISAKENAIKENKLLEAASVEVFNTPPEAPPEAPAFEESEKPSQKAPIKGKAAGMFAGLAGVQLKKVKPTETKKSIDKEEENLNDIIDLLKTPTARLYKLLMNELDSQTKDKLKGILDKLENFEMEDSDFPQAIKALSSEIRSNIVVAYNKAKQVEQASLKAQQRERERDEKRQSDPFVRTPREIAPDTPRTEEQRREILQKLLQSRGINDKQNNIEPSIYSTDHQNIDNLKKTIAGASDGLRKLIAAHAKNQERKKALLSQAAEIGGRADRALKRELHAFRQKVKDEMEEVEKEEADSVAPSFQGKLTDIINKIPQADQAKFLEEQQELLLNDIDLAIKIQHARVELTDLRTALDKAIKNKMNVLQAELGNVNQRYQAFAQAKVARGEEQSAEGAKSAADENVSAIPLAPPIEDRTAEEAAKPEIPVAPPEAPIPEAPRRTSSIPPREIKAKREREVSPEAPGVEVPEAPSGAPDLSVSKSFKPTVTKVKASAPEVKPRAPEIKPNTPEIAPIAAEPKLTPPEVKPHEAAEPKVPRAPSFKADTLPGFRKSMDKEEADKPALGPTPTPERKPSLDSQRPPEKDKTRISLEQNMPLLIKVMLESEANIAKEYAAKRKEATRWFQKGSRVDDVKFIEEVAKLAQGTRKFRDTTGEEKDLTDTDRLLAYIGALELIQWKLQTESRFFERKSTLAKMVDDKIKNSMDLLRKNKEYSDKDQWPESTIHTIAYQKLYAIKPTPDAAKNYKSSIWEAKEDLWPRIGKNIEDFDINKIRGTKKEKRKPGV